MASNGLQQADHDDDLDLLTAGSAIQGGSCTNSGQLSTYRALMCLSSLSMIPGINWQQFCLTNLQPDG